MKEFLSNAVQEIKPKRETNLVWFGKSTRSGRVREYRRVLAQYQIKTWTYVIDSVSNTKSTGKCMESGLVGGVLDAAL